MGNQSKNIDKQVKALAIKVTDIDNRLKKVEDKVFPPTPPVDHGCLPPQYWDEIQQKCVDKLPGPPTPPKPTEGRTKDWGGNQDPKTWSAVTMRDDPTKYKVVDDKAINIADQFTSQQTAQGYIDYYVYLSDNPPPPPPPPVDHGCLPNQHWDDSLQKCVDTPDNPPPLGGSVDAEGIQMLYADDPTKIAQQFFLKRDGPNSSRVDGKGARKLNADGSVTITPDSGSNPATARIYVGTTNPKFKDQATQEVNGKDWNKMKDLPDPDGQKRGGWMVNDFDFRDVEMTHYYKIPTIKDDDEMTDYVGGNHPSGGFPGQCVSSCYKAQIQTQDCTTRAAIEWDHYNSPSNYAWWDGKKDAIDLKAALGGTMAGKLIGQKWCRYNEVVNGQLKAVHMELYVDLESINLPKPDYTKQKWQKLNEWVHDGTNWPSKPADSARESACNAKGITMPAHGGPYAALRFDVNDWTLYSLSVRPIDPTKKLT